MSDLPGPVPAPTGPTEGPAAQATIVEPAPEAPSIINAPELKTAPPVAASGEVLLAVTDPWYTARFDPSIPGCPVISRTGTSVPSQFAQQAIAAGAANGVTVEQKG